jgi:hypothetical protein
MTAVRTHDITLSQGEFAGVLRSAGSRMLRCGLLSTCALERSGGLPGLIPGRDEVVIRAPHRNQSHFAPTVARLRPERATPAGINWAEMVIEEVLDGASIVQQGIIPDPYDRLAPARIRDAGAAIDCSPSIVDRVSAGFPTRVHLRESDTDQEPFPDVLGRVRLLAGDEPTSVTARVLEILLPLWRPSGAERRYIITIAPLVF